jgi:antitoxin (DNA-binding transcriptional repressor) of toxin-antitoxin stability system
MEVTISATYLARHLSDVLNRVYYKGDRFVVERNGEVVATLEVPKPVRPVSLREIAAALDRIALPDKQFFDELEQIQASQPPLPEPPEWPS